MDIRVILTAPNYSSFNLVLRSLIIARDHDDLLDLAPGLKHHTDCDNDHLSLLNVELKGSCDELTSWLTLLSETIKESEMEVEALIREINSAHSSGVKVVELAKIKIPAPDKFCKWF